MKNYRKSRILFVSESVTLAHFARPFALSNTLPKNNYDIHFACDSTYQKFLSATQQTTLHTISSISSEQFKQALAKGSPLYDFETLKHYVEEDLELINKVKPDIIVGDFRISLAVSAQLSKIPYATISNAYWSPYAPKSYPMPCLPFTKYLGEIIGSKLFKLIAPIVFKAHALSMRRLYNHFNLPKVDLDLRRVYTQADYTMYADIPSLFPLYNLPNNHFFIGPLLWSPSNTEPDWWENLPTNRLTIYVSMGSSGSNQALKTLISILSKEDITVVAATAGGNISLPNMSNIFTAPYLDGNAAANRADLVICNGGSLACQQAFAQGKPVLGVAANMDQFLNMEAISRNNAGLTLRSDSLTASNVLNSYHAILKQTSMIRTAKELQREVNHLLNKKIFVQFISSLLR